MFMMAVWCGYRDWLYPYGAEMVDGVRMMVRECVCWRYGGGMVFT